MTGCQHLMAQTEWQGTTYELFCNQPGTRYLNRTLCALHAPATPVPDPTRTAAALAAQPTATKPKEYGTTGEATQIDVANVRVVKAHTDAVLAAMGTAGGVITAVGMDEFAKSMAAAVLSAEDHETRWVVVVRSQETGRVNIFGTYLTYAAAQKALDSGHLSPTDGEGKAGIFPLTPAPRSNRKKKGKS